MQCALLEAKPSTREAWDVDETEVKRRTRRRPSPSVRTPASSTGSADRKAYAELVETMMAHLRAGGDARLRKVRRLRAAIKVGVYENNLKLQVALDRMLRDHGV